MTEATTWAVQITANKASVRSEESKGIATATKPRLRARGITWAVVVAVAPNLRLRPCLLQTLLTAPLLLPAPSPPPLPPSSLVAAAHTPLSSHGRRLQLLPIMLSVFSALPQTSPPHAELISISPVRSHNPQSYEPLLLENEREAVADLLQYLESESHAASRFDTPLLKEDLLIADRTTTNFFTGSPLSALTTLSFSDNVDLQRSAALAFAEITEKEVRPVGRDTLDPILFLLGSHDTEVQRAASAALGNLAVNSACLYHAPDCRLNL